MNDDLERSGHGLIEVLFQHFLGWTEEKQDPLLPGKPVSRARHEPDTFQLQV
jgi:hypothetical protein